MEQSKQVLLEVVQLQQLLLTMLQIMQEVMLEVQAIKLTELVLARDLSSATIALPLS